jgi:hypothetical protein
VNADIASVTGDNEMSGLGGAGGQEEEKDSQALIIEKERLEDAILKMNEDMKNKNEKILELLDEMEELKI